MRRPTTSAPHGYVTCPLVLLSSRRIKRHAPMKRYGSTHTSAASGRSGWAVAELGGLEDERPSRLMAKLSNFSRHCRSCCASLAELFCTHAHSLVNSRAKYLVSLQPRSGMNGGRTSLRMYASQSTVLKNGWRLMSSGRARRELGERSRKARISDCASGLRVRLLRSSGLWTTLLYTSVFVAPWNGVRPTSISYSMTPTLHQSSALVCTSLRTVSGARYSALPTKERRRERENLDRARPKSVRRMWPSPPMTTFSGLRSRWHTSYLWMCSIARITSQM
mmetsp:Transcript_19813/g.61518  ORF Transcript_19813/g.61518 Transcript_19813/m.61518 type:complete len:278 (-) Transcript_19813:504-1337(-)